MQRYIHRTNDKRIQGGYINALITGKSGFVGTYLSDYLELNDIHTFAYDLHDGDDLRDYGNLRNKIDQIRPDYIYHLAAQAFVPESFHNPQRTFEVNTIGSLNILEAVRQLGLKTRILLAGTSEEYGNGEVSEESKLQPLSPYAISKMAMDQLGQLYAKSYGLNVVVTRAFNHTGAGRGEMYAESAFAKQIVRIERNQQSILEHGNLESIRNYTDVQDIAKAYSLAIDLPSDVYNICSDQNISIKDILKYLCDMSILEITTKLNPSLFRPVDFSFYPPKCDKFKNLTKWNSSVPIVDTLSDILNYWREKL